MASKVPAERGSVSGEADRYYILAAAALADDQDLVLKEGDTFGVFDRSGDIRPIGLAEEGLYHEGTRYLSRLSLRFGQQQPLLLSSAIKRDNALSATFPCAISPTARPTKPSNASRRISKGRGT